MGAGGLVAGGWVPGPHPEIRTDQSPAVEQTLGQQPTEPLITSVSLMASPVLQLPIHFTSITHIVDVTGGYPWCVKHIT